MVLSSALPMAVADRIALRNPFPPRGGRWRESFSVYIHHDLVRDPNSKYTNSSRRQTPPNTKCMHIQNFVYTGYILIIIGGMYFFIWYEFNKIGREKKQNGK